MLLLFRVVGRIPLPILQLCVVGISAHSEPPSELAVCDWPNDRTSELDVFFWCNDPVSELALRVPGELTLGEAPQAMDDFLRAETSGSGT